MTTTDAPADAPLPDPKMGDVCKLRATPGQWVPFGGGKQPGMIRFARFPDARVTRLARLQDVVEVVMLSTALEAKVCWAVIATKFRHRRGKK